MAINIALGISILGFFSFVWGYTRRLGMAIAHAVPRLPAVVSENRALLIALFCAFCGWFIRIYLALLQTNSLTTWIFTRKDILYRTTVGVTYMRVISDLATVASLSFLLLYRLGNMRRKRLYLLLWAALFSLELFYGFLSGKRASIPLLSLQTLVAHYMVSRRDFRTNLKLSTLGIALIVSGAILFPIVSQVRFRGLDSLPNSLTEYSLMDSFKMVGRRLHDLDSLALIVKKVPAETPYTMGAELGLISVAWIPRSLWPQKPTIALGEIFRKEIVPPNIFKEGTSVSVSLLGQFYWDFGVIAVFIGMFIVGVIWRFLYEYLIRPRNNFSNALVASAIFPFFFMPLEQTVVAVLTRHTFEFLLIVLLASIIGVPKKR